MTSTPAMAALKEKGFPVETLFGQERCGTF